MTELNSSADIEGEGAQIVQNDTRRNTIPPRPSLLWPLVVQVYDSLVFILSIRQQRNHQSSSHDRRLRTHSLHLYAHLRLGNWLLHFLFDK